MCMIVKNEEQVLDRCLTSVVKFADEIIIVDTGSSDGTIDIARKYTKHVYTFEWVDDFALARNYSFSLATSDYVMWIDADDVVPDSSVIKLLELKQNMTADCYMMPYHVGFDGNYVTHSYYRERILNSKVGYVWHGCVHECITPSGVIEYVDIPLEHRKIKVGYSDRNLKIYENKLQHTQLDPRETYYYARELYYHARYQDCVDTMNKFFNMGGFVENIIDGHIITSACYVELKDVKNALIELYHTFDYDVPRANVCCKLGDIYKCMSKYKIAIHWYNQATKCEVCDKKGGFVENECYNYYPYLQMCVCYYQLGNYKLAQQFNYLAGKFKTNDKYVEHNKKVFKKLLEK